MEHLFNMKPLKLTSNKFQKSNITPKSKSNATESYRPKINPNSSLIQLTTNKNFPKALHPIAKNIQPKLNFLAKTIKTLLSLCMISLKVGLQAMS